MRDADHRRLGDRRVRHQHLLDFGRIDVEPVDQDQLAQPVDQEQVAVGVGVRDVAGRPPTVGIGSAVAVGPVTGEEVRAAHDDLARIGARRAGRVIVEVVDLVDAGRCVAAPHVGAGRVDQSDVDARQAPARSSLPSAPGPASVVVTTGAVSVSPYPTASGRPKTACELARDRPDPAAPRHSRRRERTPAPSPNRRSCDQAENIVGYAEKRAHPSPARQVDARRCRTSPNASTRTPQAP